MVRFGLHIQFILVRGLGFRCDAIGPQRDLRRIIALRKVVVQARCDGFLGIDLVLLVDRGEQLGESGDAL
jgi:hypothetical protein